VRARRDEILEWRLGRAGATLHVQVAAQLALHDELGQQAARQPRSRRGPRAAPGDEGQPEAPIDRGLVAIVQPLACGSQAALVE
jgi:hypothetical protein